MTFVFLKSILVWQTKLSCLLILLLGRRIELIIVNTAQSTCHRNSSLYDWCKRTGNDGNALSYDFSTAVYDPLGKSVPLLSSAESDLLSVVNVDFSVVDQTRSSFGVLNDKKYSLYHSLLPVS